MEASRADLIARIDSLSQALTNAPTRRERREGWVPAARSAIVTWLTDMRLPLLDESDVLDPRELLSSSEALKGLDAWGVDVASDDPITSELLSIADDLRKHAW